MVLTLKKKVYEKPENNRYGTLTHSCFNKFIPRN